jgi:uncharacterized coiled-coil protein SlyX
MTDHETNRFEAIEMQLAHQEMLLTQLNDAITQQQDSIMKLEARCDSILARVHSISELVPGGSAEDERPPHY